MIVHFLGQDQNLELCTSGKDLSCVLSILANLVQMGEHYENLKEIVHPSFVVSFDLSSDLVAAIQSGIAHYRYVFTLDQSVYR